MPRILVSSLAAAALLAGLAGCSSDNGGGGNNNAATTSTVALPPAPKNANTEAGLTEAATDYFTWGGEHKVPEQYVVLSARCREKWTSLAAWQGNVDAARNILVGLGFNVDGASVASATPEAFTPEASSVRAVVKTADGKNIDAFATSKWVYEDGGWRVDSCESAMGG
jgi:hypothetical protein